jgi:hypothetical protein
MGEMTVDDLIGMLENFDGSSEVAIEVDFQALTADKSRPTSSVFDQTTIAVARNWASRYTEATLIPGYLTGVEGQGDSNTRGVLCPEISPENARTPNNSNQYSYSQTLVRPHRQD